MASLRRFAFSFALTTCALVVGARAQTPAVYTVNVTPTENSVRVTTVGDILDLRLVVSDESGNVVFEGGPAAGAELDWPLTDAQGRRAPAGNYTLTATYRTAGGRLKRRVEQILVTEGAAAGAERESAAPTTDAPIDGTGTAGRIAKFTSATQVGNSALVESAGKIGLGTAAPAQSLHVSGASSRLRLESSNGPALSSTEYYTSGRDWQSGAGGSTAANGVANKFFVFDQTAGQFRLVVDQSGNVGIGTTAPASKLAVNGSLQILGAGSGIKFPDGTVQTTAGSGGGGLSSVSHNGTLVGAGTPGSPLGVAVPLTLAGNSPNPILFVANGSGGQAISTTGAINTSAHYSIGGNRVLGQGSSGTSTFVGLNAGAISTGPNNSFFGATAGFNNTTGDRNTFIGFNAGWSNKAGRENTFVGASAGLKTGTDLADSNSFFGADAGKENVNGTGNSFFGARAGNKNTGHYNTALGVAAGTNNTEGGSNVFVGRAAGLSNTIEIGNTFLGAFSNGAPGVKNSVAIGLHAQVTQSNSIVLGAISGVNTSNFNTNVGIGVTAPKAKLHVKGGDVYIAQPNSLVITSPDGACWQIRVNNAGALSAASVPCP